MIDCGTRRVEVTGGSLIVHDGGFRLNARSLLVQGRDIIADCPQGTAGGFLLETTEGITVGTGGRLKATCGAAGGKISLRAGTDATVGGSGIEANATATNGRAGGVRIHAGGTVSSSAQIQAQSTGSGTGGGGAIEIQGTTVTISKGLVVRATNGDGGTISIDAAGSFMINGQNDLDATGGAGDGGEISLLAGGSCSVTRPLKVPGNGPAGSGGMVEIDADAVLLDAQVLASGTTGGGEINIESRGGAIGIATLAASAVELDVRRSGHDAARAGGVSLRSRGSDVTLAALARLLASGGGTMSQGGASPSTASA